MVHPPLFESHVPRGVAIDFEQAILASDPYEFSPCVESDARDCIRELGLVNTLCVLGRPRLGKYAVQDIRRAWESIRKPFHEADRDADTAAQAAVRDAKCDGSLPPETNRQLVLAILHLGVQACTVCTATSAIQDALATLRVSGQDRHPVVEPRIRAVEAILEEMQRLTHNTIQ